MKKILNSSITIIFWKQFCERYNFTIQRIGYIYQNSLTDKLTDRFREKIKICFRYSFLGRITETRQITPSVLEDSHMVQYLNNSYEKWKDKIVRYLRASLTTVILKDTKEQLNFSPVRIISMIVITAITVNVVLSMIFQIKIGSWGWVTRGLFLFLAVPGLSCKADWPTVKKSSIFFRKI